MSNFLNPSVNFSLLGRNILVSTLLCLTVPHKVSGAPRIFIRNCIFECYSYKRAISVLSLVIRIRYIHTYIYIYIYIYIREREIRGNFYK
jgi:hypothetical protein